MGHWIKVVKRHKPPVVRGDVIYNMRTIMITNGMFGVYEIC